MVSDLKHFLGHFNRTGLDRVESGHAERFISRLYDATCQLWIPNHCRRLFIGTEVANRARMTGGFDGVFGEVLDRRYGREHFFWISPMNSGKVFVIDPTGLEMELNGSAEGYAPYFGLPENAQGILHNAYKNMEPLDEWGTRDPQAHVIGID